MQTVLVHIDSGLGPIGAWGFLGGTLKHFYPESLDVEISARARSAMAARGNDVPVPEWFHQLASRTPHLDDYEAIELNDGVSLPAVVAEFRRAWRETA